MIFPDCLYFLVFFVVIFVCVWYFVSFLFPFSYFSKILQKHSKNKLRWYPQQPQRFIFTNLSEAAKQFDKTSLSKCVTHVEFDRMT